MSRKRSGPAWREKKNHLAKQWSDYKYFQQVVEVIPTNNPAEDNMVVHMIRHGFKYGDVVLRPEEVVIKKYNP